MKAYISASTGIVVGVNEADHPAFVRSARDDFEWEGPSVPHLVSHIDDWEEVNWQDSSNEFEEVARRHRTIQLANLCMALLDGLSNDLERELLLLLEELLQTGASSHAATSRLLIAPLKYPERVALLAQVALSLNCSATAHLLDELAALQPLLSRFSSLWLQLPTRSFVGIGKSQSEIWVFLAEQQLNRHLIESKNQIEFKKHWSSLAFKESQPHARSAIVALGNHLAATLFPAAPNYQDHFSNERDDLPAPERGKQGRPVQHIAPDVKLKRALKQVENISKAAAKGDDVRAQRFLRELIESQRGEDAEYAVKSLCNIAKQCGDMFRADFERQCLEQALRLKPHDSWALIQWGDHLKRTGQFDQAIKAFQEAAGFGAPLVATTAIADVWRQRGDYARALDTYHSVHGWESDRLIRMATADVLRISGKFQDAILEYNRILTEWPLESRAKAGLAEIHKHQGDLEEALRLYNEALEMNLDDKRTWFVFRSARCHILKLHGNLDEAFNSVDRLIKDAPFHMEARLQRASILALMGKAQDGLMDVPEVAPRAFGEWRQGYLRGLLLFKLSRYAEARKLLLERLNSGFVQHESLYQLVAAYAYLQLDNADPHQAQSLLIGVNNLNDVHSEHILLVLNLHVATLNDDQARAQEIRRKLSAAARKHSSIQGVVIALAGRNFKKALTLELEMFLNVA